MAANPGLTLTFTALADIAPRRIVKIMVGDSAQQASAAADPILGVSERVGAATGERVDVIFSGVAEVEFGPGGGPAPGASLTSDANGKAVTAAAGNRAIGYALELVPPGGGWARVLIHPHKA